MWELLPSDYCFGQEHHAQTVPLQFDHGRSFSSGEMDGREWMARGHSPFSRTANAFSIDCWNALIAAIVFEIHEFR